MGCANPAASYVAQHPELSAEHRKILLEGKIRDGDAVAGLTKAQVRVAMRTPPDQFTTFNGQEAWVYLHGTYTPSHRSRDDSGVRVTPGAPVPGEDPLGAGSGFDHPHAGKGGSDSSGGSGSDSYGAGDKKTGTRTTILFVGDHATHAEVTRE